VIRLRPATREDGALLREWRNDPETVAASLTGRAVEPDEHQAWLELALDNPAERLFVVEDDGEPAGQVRLQRHPEGDEEVHIGLAAEARGRGLGRAALELAWSEKEGEVLIARVLGDNERSLRAFAAAGFTERSREGREVLLERRA
jgi:RimJ/RimL family protein N-acetyltransferase